MAKGSVTVAGEDRKVKTAVRKTAIGKAVAHQTEKQRLQNERMMKANLKAKVEEDEEEEGSDWESVEEDAPVIQLEDLLNNMKIDADENEEESGDEEEEESKQ